ncbi:MAG TPA: YhcH/YjgK/YiaL family protein [Pirellulales bacterium]|nr:YhcH/YjgK/YiaL family protein [Pirellulales bacterium]
MVLEKLSNWPRYATLHPGFEAAFRWLADARPAELPTGKHAIDGERLYVLINRDPGRGRDGAKLEVHRRYIDIQLTLAGDEEIGWSPLADCGPPEADYSTEGDVAFYVARPQTWLAVPPGTFAIFYPDDAHAPLAGRGDLVKAVMKVAVAW